MPNAQHAQPKIPSKLPEMTSFASRMGTESALNVVGEVAKLVAEGKSIVSLSAGQPDFPTPPHIQEAAIKAIRDGHHGYTPPAGIAPLREAVADYLMKLHGCPPIHADDILIQPGGKPTMFHAIILFGAPGREIIYPDPGFPIYRSLIDAVGATPVPYALRTERSEPVFADDVLAKITPQTSLLIVNNPGNPCGNVWSSGEIERLAKGLAAFPHVAIMSDEIYCQILYDQMKFKSFLCYPELRDRLILLDGWSKSFSMTGWRLGMAVWPKAWRESALRMSINYHSCPNAPTQFAGLAALTGPQDSIRQMVASFDERRRYLHPALNALPGCSAALPKGAFYMMLDIEKTGIEGHVFQQELLHKAGVATVAGRSFGNVSLRQVRLSFASSMDNLKEAVRRIDAHLQQRLK